MTQTLRALMLALAAVVALASPSFAQLPNRKDVVERVDKACPGLIRDSHAFTDAVWTVLHGEDPRWGRNGKRGNPNDLSDDAGTYLNPASPLVGSDGRRVNVIDMIGCAGGGPNCSPSPAWIDQTQATIDARTTGVWVAPSGVLPSCLGGGAVVQPPPPDKPPPTPAPVVVDLGPVMAKLSAIESRLIRLEAMDPPVADVGLLNEYVDDMIGNGPGGDEPNHITDLKQRLDKQRALLEELTRWLKSRRALGF